MSRLAFIAASIAVLLPPAAAQAAPSQAEIDRVFEAFDRPDSPGCAVGVVREGEVVLARGYGMANLEHEIRNGPRTAFDLGSTSKQFTAASVMLLVLDGRLSLDDDIRKFVPEIPDYGRTIRVRNLVHHTSGLRDYLNLMILRGVHTEDLTTAGDALALLARQKAPNFPAGEEFLYSNSGYFLLSVVVERVSGQSLARFAKERLFDPLGMRDTRFQDDHTRLVPRRATGYAPRPEGGFGIDMSDFEQTGDGAVLSTVEDLVKWDRNFTTHAVGGVALCDLLHQRGKLANGSEIAYAGGLVHDEHRGLRTVSHGGAWAGYRAELLRFPDQKLTVVCLCNLASANPGRLARRVAALYLAGSMTEPASRPASRAEGAADTRAESRPVPAAALSDYAGRYRSDELDVAWEIAVAGERLVARVRPDRPLELRPEGVDRFSGGGITLAFARGADRAVTAFEIEMGRVRGVTFVRGAADAR